MEKSLTTTYVAYSPDYPYLPCFVTDSLCEFSLWLGVSRSYVQFCLKFDTPCRGHEVRCFYGLDLDD